MPVTSRVEQSGAIMGRLDRGDDILDSLSRICADLNLTMGRIEAIGAVQKGRIGFYDQAAGEYEYREFDHPMEIVGLRGNISLKDGKPFVHAHVTLADDNGSAFGGHLCRGTIAFACEFVISIFEGGNLERQQDPDTGLAIWMP